MKKFIHILSVVSLASVVAASVTFASVTPRELSERIDEGESIALIDVRSNAAFTKTHIPGAMNISARVVDPRRLPQSRPVVFYDDGLGRADAAAVVEQVVAAGRSDVELLRGGFAAWESAGLPTTEATGFQKDSVPGITYQTLMRGKGRDVVLFDVRETESSNPDSGEMRVAAAQNTGSLTELSEVLPQARVIKPGGGGDSGERRVAMSAETASPLAAVNPEDELIVVVDDGDGTAEDVVRRLRAAGNRRVVHLIGGERILSRDGRPGLERQSIGVQTIDGSEQGQEEALR